MGAMPPRMASTREFAFERADFLKVQQMLFKKAGIKLTDAKEAMVYSRLARRKIGRASCRERV